MVISAPAKAEICPTIRHVWMRMPGDPERLALLQLALGEALAAAVLGGCRQMRVTLDDGGAWIWVEATGGDLGWFHLTALGRRICQSVGLVVFTSDGTWRGVRVVERGAAGGVVAAGGCGDGPVLVGADGERSSEGSVRGAAGDGSGAEPSLAQCPFTVLRFSLVGRPERSEVVVRGEKVEWTYSACWG